MQMFWQNNLGVDGEGAPLIYHTDNLTEDVNVIYQQGLSPFGKNDGEINVPPATFARRYRIASV